MTLPSPDLLPTLVEPYAARFVIEGLHNTEKPTEARQMPAPKATESRRCSENQAILLREESEKPREQFENCRRRLVN